MKSHVRVLVIGGGVVGCSVLYHLTKLGWHDVALVERRELTAGSSWHAAGLFHALNSDMAMSRLQAYTVSLYAELERISGQSIGLHYTGDSISRPPGSAGISCDLIIPVARFWDLSPTWCHPPRCTGDFP